MAKLLYYGHSCWDLQQDGTSVVIDPFLTDNPWTKSLPQALKPNLILLTHGHFDHLGDALALAKRSGAPILAIKELADYVEEQGLESIDGNFGGVVKQPFGWVKFVPAWHSSSWTPPGEAMRSTIPNGFVINFFGRTFYDSGDTTLFGDMKLIGEVTPIEVALLPIGGHYTMGIDDAVRAVQLLSPKVVVPMHYSTWPPIEQDPQEFKRQVEAKTSSRCQVVKPGTFWEVPDKL